MTSLWKELRRQWMNAVGTVVGDFFTAIWDWIVGLFR